MAPTPIQLFLFALYAINHALLAQVNSFQIVLHVPLDFSKTQQLECAQINVLSDFMEVLFKDCVNPVTLLVKLATRQKILTVL
jgi:hypothetical protein